MRATRIFLGIPYLFGAAAMALFSGCSSGGSGAATGARAKNAIPVLVTPPPRNSAYCGGGRSLANYGQAMIELGAADKVAVIDLGIKTWSYLNKSSPKPASGDTEMFFKVTGTTLDGTHFQENGARIMAGFVADGVGEASLGLDAFRIN